MLHNNTWLSWHCLIGIGQVTRDPKVATPTTASELEAAELCSQYSNLEVLWIYESHWSLVDAPFRNPLSQWENSFQIVRTTFHLRHFFHVFYNVEHSLSWPRSGSIFWLSQITPFSCSAFRFWLLKRVIPSFFGTFLSRH